MFKTKQKRRSKMKFKRVLAIVLALVMVLGLAAIPSFADGDPGNVTSQATLEYGEEAEINVGLTKSVATGHDAGFPAGLTYSFTVEQVTGLTVRDGAPSKSGISYSVEPVPATGDSLGINGTYTVTPAAGDKLATTQYGYSASTDYYKKEAAILTGKADGSQTSGGTGGFTVPDTFTGTGVSAASDIAIYAYKITEQQLMSPETGWKKEVVDGKTVYTRPDPPTEVVGEFNEKLTLSKAEYVMYVYTKPTADGTDRYVFAITCVQTLNNEGDTIQEVEKKNITIGGSTGIEGDFSQMEFQNNYLKTPVTDPTDPDGQPYQISKIVTGVDNDMAILNNASFDFAVTVTKGATDDAETAVGRLWVSDDGANYTPMIYDDAAGTGVEGTDYVKLPADSNWPNVKQKIQVFRYNDEGVATGTVTLKNNEKITFPHVPAGTTFKVVEEDYYTTGVAGTTPAGGGAAPVYNLTPIVNAEPWVDLKVTEDTANNKWVFNGVAYDTEDEAKAAAAAKLLDLRTDEQTVEIDAATNKLKEKASNYQNDGSTGTTPTGIIMQYLPFFVIIALAIVALAASVVIKGRRRSRA